MSDKLNIAVVGCGYWGPNLARNFDALPDCNMRLVCDTDEERLAHMKQTYRDVETTTSFEDVVTRADIDAVVIATPIHTHYPLAKRSLLAGKHTFVEKPLASSVAQCEELIEISDSMGLTHMVGHTFLYTPAVRYLKEMIDGGELGDVYYISSARLNLGLFQKDFNVVWDLAPHDLSIILYLIKDHPLTVNCQGKAHVTPGLEDVSNMSINFTNGSFATIQSSWLDPNKVRRMTIVGSKCMVVYDDIEPNEKVKIYDKKVTVPPHYDTFAEFQYSYHYGEMRAPHIKQVEPLKVECQEFLDCIRSGRKSVSSAVEGLEVVRILEACSNSLNDGGRCVSLVDNPRELFRQIASA